MTTRTQPLFPLFFTVFLDLLGIGIIIPIIAPLLLNPFSGVLPTATSEDMRTIILGFLIAAYPLAQFFGAPILGALADRHGRKRVLILSLIGTLIGYVIFAYGVMSENIWLLFASRALDGFTGGNISIVQSAIADISDEKTKAKNFGLIGMAFGVGFVVGPYVGGKLADPHIVSWFSFSTPFWCAALLTAVNIALVVWRVSETVRERRERPVSLFTGVRNVSRAFTLPRLRVLFLTMFLFAFGFNFFTQFFQVYLIQQFQMTQSQIGDVFAYIGIWIAIAQGGITRPVSMRFNQQQILRWSLILLACALPTLLIPQESWGLLIVLPFVAVFNGLAQPNATSLISNAADAQSQGEILGINQSIQAIAQAIPPILAGFIVNIHSYLPITISGISIFFAWVIFVAWYSRSQKKQFHEI